MESFPWNELVQFPLIAVLVWLLLEKTKAIKGLRDVITMQSTAIELLKQMSILNNAKLEQILTEILRGGRSDRKEKS